MLFTLFDSYQVEPEVIRNMKELTNCQTEYDLLVIFTPISDKEFGSVHADHRGNDDMPNLC